jgi:hypothetical protein
MTLLRAVASWWWSPMSGGEDPQAADARRLAAMRLWIGGFAIMYVSSRLPDFMASARLPRGQFAPIGVVRLLDGPLSPTVAFAISVVTIVLLAAFVLGAAYRWTAPAAASALLWTLSYRNSWGMVFHTENLLVLHVMALACTPAADTWSLDARAGRRAAAAAASTTGYAWAIRVLIALTVVTYVLAGVAKLRLAGTGWLDGEQLRNQIAIDNLRKALLGDFTAPLAIPLLEHPSGFTVFSILTLVLELGSPVALLGGRLAKLWAAGAWSFHIGVVLLMNIWFPYPLLGLAYLPVLRGDRPITWAIGRARKLRTLLRRSRS